MCSASVVFPEPVRPTSTARSLDCGRISLNNVGDVTSETLAESVGKVVIVHEPLHGVGETQQRPVIESNQKGLEQSHERQHQDFLRLLQAALLGQTSCHLVQHLD